MAHALDQDQLSILSTVLLQNLDEEIFFSKLSGYIFEVFGEYKVRVFSSFDDGSTKLIAENGKIVDEGMVYAKGQGLSGYVVRTKRAYYSNSKRDPLLSTTKRDECVEKELCVPLSCDGSVLGTIHVQSKDEQRTFGQDDVTTILEILAGIRPAINNMKLYLLAKNLNKVLAAKLEEKDFSNAEGPKSLATNKSKSKIEIIGHSNRMLDILTMANKIAKEDFPIMIKGETGTGKKLLAKKIHNMSLRSNAECVLVHCGAIDASRIEQELFGMGNNKGLIEKADNGTLVLDNVHDLPLAIQAKLLRAVLSGEIFRLDSKIATKVNVRIISITNNDIDEAVDEGKFREDLMYRLNIISMSVPSLKERQEDIKLLAEYFLNKGKKQEDFKILTSAATKKLTHYNWPGNLQELRNLMERTFILADGKYIDESDLPGLTVEVQEEEVEVIEFSEMSLHELEKEHICRTLEHLGGNKTRAAKSLGITVKTLYNKLHSYGLVQPKAQ